MQPLVLTTVHCYSLVALRCEPHALVVFAHALVASSFSKQYAMP